MALDLGPGGNYLVAAIIIGIVLLAAQIFAFSLGVLGQILLVAAIILLIVWGLKLIGLI